MTRSSETYFKFLKFLVIGSMAFLIDAMILQALVSLAGFSPFLGRFFSFSVAVVFTWLANRTVTFGLKYPPHLREFFGYVFSQSIGLGINVGIYSLCILNYEITHEFPVLALVPATSASMMFNFFSMKKFVFKN